MTNNLDALLTAPYVHLDDRVLPALGWSRITGRAVSLPCPMRSWPAWRRRSICWALPPSGAGSGMPVRTWPGCSRTCPASPGTARGCAGWAGLLAAVITGLARDTASWHDLLRLVDSTPLPSAASRETVKRSDLAGHAGYGYCASHSRFFWGFRLYLITTPEGMPVIWGLAHPGLGERGVTQALLERDHHLVRAGRTLAGVYARVAAADLEIRAGG